ncbi:MAG: MFS transporter [Thermoleophilia bacterium]|nr:MFS transporter [Thermoleophilia bacterium]
MGSLWPRGGLWRHGDFLKLWTGETISQFGSHVTALAFPLVAILVLEASAFQVALLGVIEMAPFILLSLPAGVWVDRLRRRPILITSDVARALLLLTVPLAYALDALSISQLYAVGFLFGVATVFFDVSYQSYLPSLVPRDRLVEGNSKLEISRSGAQLTGPGLAGALIEALTAPVAVFVDAVSFLASAGFLLRIRRAERAPERSEATAKPSMRSELREGLAYVLGHRHLRWIAASTATFNLFGSVMFAIFLVFAVRELGLRPGVIGLVFAVGNVGALAGAVLANRIAARIGVGPTIVIGAAFGGGSLLYALAPASSPIPFLIAAQVLVSFGIPVYNITQVSFRQAITPERLQGRMNSVMRFIVWGVMPLGSLAGGALATAAGLRTAIWVGAAGTSLAFLPVLLSSVRSLRAMPEPYAEPLPSEGSAEGGMLGPTQLPAADEG